MAEATIKITVDTELDVAYIRLSSNKVARTVELTDDVMVDVDALGVVIGVEVLALDAVIPFTRLHEELHVHSDVIEILRQIQPSVAASMRLTQGSEGTSRAANRSGVKLAV